MCVGVEMAEVLVLSSLVRQPQTAAAEDVCGLFERTVARHNHMSRSQEDHKPDQ